MKIIAIVALTLLLLSACAPKPECKSKDDCIPAQCCHPTNCIAGPRDKPCNLLCTQECMPNTLDCKQGYCDCVSGKCEAVIVQK
jgi:hypothetical protein